MFILATLNNNAATTEEQTSLLPISNSITADLFLQVIYALLLAIGSRAISHGIELMMEVVSVGLVGGLVLPLLGALPDSVIVFFSTMGGQTIEETQHRVQVGVGSLAGSNIFLLTIPFAVSIWHGRCDILKGVSVNKTYTNFTWKHTGVSTLPYCMILARVMIITVIPYLIIQLSYILYSRNPLAQLHEKEKYWALCSFIICFVGFIGYSIYQIYDVRYQEKKLNLARKRFLWEQFFKHMSIQLKNSIKKKTLTRSTSTSKVIEGTSMSQNNMKIPKPNFEDSGNINNIIDDDAFSEADLGNRLTTQKIGGRNQLIKSDYLQKPSLISNLMGIDNRNPPMSAKQMTTPTKINVTKKLSSSTGGIKLNPSSTSLVDTEHQQQLQQFRSPKGRAVTDISDTGSYYQSNNNNENKQEEDFGSDNYLPTVHQEMETVYEGLKNKIQDLDEDDLIKHADEHQIIDLNIEPFPEKPKKVDRRNILIKSILYLVGGTVLIVLFADAFVESISVFSERIHIRSFYISFVVAPLALNCSELVTSYYLSQNKKRKHISLIHSSLYGAVSMNNLISLGTLLLMIYLRGLVWSFSAECLVILISTVFIGLLGSLKQTFNMVHCVVIASLYPLSIVIIILLESSAIGWN
ncbi:hypothetical protein DLAC_03815 [Tieghemostelium lacteum]|uniref:Sodium/calcium exchanger membrane region domain-containing protein n=1 Tax=Tieghemostelium lacteum TaxID=361077 RepID=A0A152A0T2_TIELA|nr:hypothetical protein DLAC_03815 [Tieghemostelium lacteum]|eukprot:KYQ99861.1 hypothetical protein DLAC_03815 [Tieghemostelium lacteum]